MKVVQFFLGCVIDLKENKFINVYNTDAYSE
jgi:hypothetical protein